MESNIVKLPIESNLDYSERAELVCRNLANYVCIKMSINPDGNQLAGLIGDIVSKTNLEAVKSWIMSSIKFYQIEKNSIKDHTLNAFIDKLNNLGLTTH